MARRSRTVAAHFGTLALATLGILSAPAFADADATNVQTDANLRALAGVFVDSGQPHNGEDKRLQAPSDFSTFDQSLEANGMHEGVVARGFAKQKSTIVNSGGTLTVTTASTTESKTTRTGNVDIDCCSGAGGVAGFSVDFTVNVRSTFALSGSISINTNGETGSSNTVIEFDGDDTILEIEVEDEPGFQRQASIAKTGILPPGDYSLGLFTSTSLGDTQTLSRSAWDITLIVVASPLPPVGSEIKWIGPSNGAFDNPDNWSPAQVPVKDDARSDTAIFRNLGSLAVNLGAAAALPASLDPRGPLAASRTVERCVISDVNLISLLGGTLTCDALSLDERSLRVDGKLALPSATVNARHVAVGQTFEGSIDVSGSGALNTSGRLSIGMDASGFLHVTPSGFVTSAESRLGDGTRGGTALVEGAGAHWLTANLAVGLTSTGTLTLQNGGNVLSDEAYIAFNPVPLIISGATVDGVASNGTSSKWEANKLFVGRTGVATLDVSGGGSVDVTTSIVIGGATDPNPVSIVDATSFASALGQVRVVKTGGTPNRASTMHAGQTITVGFGGDGMLTVDRGGFVSSTDTINIGVGSHGVVEIGLFDLDNISQLSQVSALGKMTIGTGVNAVGELKITPFGQAAAGSASVGVAKGTGRVLLTGNVGDQTVTKWRITGNLAVGDEESIGVVTINDALVDVANNVTVGALGRIQGTNGKLLVAGNIANGGTISPGLSPGTLTIEGNLIQGAGGRILLEVAGSDPEDMDHLTIDGDATLGGRLVLQFMNGFAPKAGTQFQLLNVNGTPSGDFGTIETAGLQPGAQLTMGFDGGAFMLTTEADTLPLQTVKLAPAKKKLKEKSRGPAKLKVGRKGTKAEIALPLEVHYTIEGTATNGIDYQLLSGSVTIPAGKKAATILLQPVDDGETEQTETIELAIAGGADYTPSLKSTSLLTLASDEKVPKAPKRR